MSDKLNIVNVGVVSVCLALGTQLLSTTLGVKEYLENEFSKLEQEILQPNKDMFPSGITLDDFIWAFGILRSRAFSRLRGQELVLVPLADLVNPPPLYTKGYFILFTITFGFEQINHNPAITTEDYAYEIKGAGLFSRDLLFSLKSPVYVKAGGQVSFKHCHLSLPSQRVYLLTLFLDYLFPPGVHSV